VTCYLLDANVFIQAKNWGYDFDLVPAFWTWTEQRHSLGTVYTVEKVAAEVEDGNDQLATWMTNQPKTFKLGLESVDVASLQTLSSWVAGQSYKPGAVAEFLSAGDYYITAQAHARGWTVVTHEQPRPASSKKVKIPDVCNGTGVAWLSPFQMLKNENVKFGVIA
jgi:hypothetical protein